MRAGAGFVLSDRLPGAGGEDLPPSPTPRTQRARLGPGSARRPRLPRRLGRLVVTRVALVFVLAAVTGISVGLAAATLLLERDVEASSILPATASGEIAAVFVRASLWSAGVGTLAALVVWGVFAQVTARQVERSVATVGQAATLLADGRYDFALSAAEVGPEAEEFARTVTTMAARLHDVERTRRRMLSDLAHELRTPIATIDGYLEAFEDGVATPDAETVQMLRGQTRRLARLAHDLGTVSRAEEGADPLERRPSDVAALVEHAVRGVRGAAAARGLALRWYAAPDLPPLDVDPERIGQVLANVLDNAVRHARTAIGVTAEPARGDGGDVREVHIRVHDDGEGIPEEDLPHVFERFYRADAARRAGEGSGIGLTIARALVARHGGRVDVTTGPGTEFAVVLPVPPRSTGVEPRPPAPWRLR